MITAAIAVALALPGSAAAAAPPGFLGLHPIGALELTNAELDHIAAARVTTLRVSIPWIRVQPLKPEPGDRSRGFNWEETNRLVRRTATRGIRLVPVVEAPPAWVTGSINEPPLGSKADKRAWQRYLRVLVRRYGPDGAFWDKLAEDSPEVEPKPIATWQIWNEQNGKNHWEPEPSPRKYAKLLRLSRRAIKGQDRKARILLGGMFGTPNAGKKPSIYSWKFLRRLYKLGAAKDFDVASAHPYSPNMKGLKIQVKLMRKEMLKVNDRKTPMWITELGWETSGTGRPGPRLPLTTEEGQASKLRRAVKLILRHRREWKMKRITWFTWRDTEAAGCQPCQSAGLLREDFSPKPAWHQFVRFTGGQSTP